MSDTVNTPPDNGHDNGAGADDGSDEAEIMADDEPSPASSRVNPQIIDAVQATNDFLLGTPPGAASGDGGSAKPKYNPGVTIANQKAAQALAYAIQDATDYQRNVISINSAAQGKALALMFKDVASGEDKKLAEHAIIFALAMVGSFVAGVTASYITKSSTSALENL